MPIPERPSFKERMKLMFSRRLILNTTLGGGLVFALFGIIFWGGFNTAMEVTNTLEFCISCHEMEDNVYKEYQKTIHYANRTGVRATCSDCHVPDPWVHKVARKIQASNEVLHKVLGTIDTPEKFDAKRLQLAKNVWRSMKSTDSRECRNCHNFEAMNGDMQKPRAMNQHTNALRSGQTCIDCHKGVAHKGVHKLLSDEEKEAMEAPDESLAKPGAKLFQLADLDPVAAAAAKAAAEKAAAEAAAKAAASAKAGDWSSIVGREIYVIYPGQTSIEWVLNGTDHGGANAFKKGGDRCFTCHDKEAKVMGDRIVGGKHEKAMEPTPIPGKRGGIPVMVKAAHDGENLYMRFIWHDVAHHNEATEYKPVADSERMDPENPVKLAMMFATDEVEFADRAGCWGTCHHDANGMPHQPEGTDVTKYTKESRTKIEVKGRRGKKRGGWDKLRKPEEIKAALDQKKIMDLVRYKSGSKQAEDGMILADRDMSGNSGDLEFEGKRDDQGNWVVDMKRKLSSGDVDDLTLVLDQVYNFGFAIHDDYTNGRFHHVSFGYKLGFDNPKAEINAVKW